MLSWYVFIVQVHGALVAEMRDPGIYGDNVEIGDSCNAEEESKTLLGVGSYTIHWEL